MGAPATPSNPRINLERASVLLVDANSQGMEIMVQVFGGFGVQSPHRCYNSIDAMELVKQETIDLIVIDANMPEMDGYDFVRWLRRSKLEPNCAVPTIIMSGHTQSSNVRKGRDCGANFIIAKPVVPQIVLERVIWVARENRAFIEASNYLGPDRRFHSIGPPLGTEGRRKDDLPLAVGAPSTPNLSQDAIDSLIQPQKAQL
jgi:CheY-like chemotaxis protein